MPLIPNAGPSLSTGFGAGVQAQIRGLAQKAEESGFVERTKIDRLRPDAGHLRVTTCPR